MIFCPNCESIRVKILDQNFTSTKPEGQPASKSDLPKKQFYCWDCGDEWDSDPECERLYFEYTQLKNETTLVAQDMKKGGTYEAQYIDPNKLMKRKEIAKKLAVSYRHLLDIGSGEWHDLEQDASL